MAYCLMGVFGINMAMLYGEGDGAFIRLQEEIIRISDDESIFAWGFGCKENQIISKPIVRGFHRKSRLLAASPADFDGCGNIRPLPASRGLSTHYSLTNKGLLIETSLVALPAPFNTVLLPLNCSLSTTSSHVLALPLRVVVSHNKKLQVDPSSRPVLLETSLLRYQSTATKTYIDTSVRMSTAVLPQLWIKIQDHSSFKMCDFRVIEVFPSWIMLERMRDSLNDFYMRAMSGLVEGEHLER